MKKEDKPKTGKVSYIFTKETLGMTMLLFSALVFLMLLTRHTVFAGLGAAICTFMYGSFGYGSWLVLAVVAYLGQRLTFGKKIKIKPSVALAVAGFVTVIFLLGHSISTHNIALNGYGSYLSACYMGASAGWAGYSFGGAVCGLIVYPVAKLTSFIGAYVIFAVLSALCGYLIFFTYMRGRPISKKSEGESVVIPERTVEENAESEPAAANVSDSVYSVNEDKEIVNAHSGYAESNADFVPPAEEKDNKDKFSRENLGRQILFNNDEFAAESYQRNLIYREESYYNHNVTTAEDYLSNFTSTPKKYPESSKKDEKAESYTQSYQQDVLNAPADDAPSSFVYGESPVSRLDEEVVNPVSYEQGDRAGQDTDSRDNYAGNSESVREYPEERAADLRPEESEDGREEEEQKEEPFRSETQEDNTREDRRNDNSSNIISSLFGGESMREDSRRPSGRSGERSNANLFDNDDDFDDNIFGNTQDSERRGLVDRSDNARTKDASFENRTGERREPTAPREERNVGFGLPLEERRAVHDPVPRREEPKEEKKEEKPKHVWKRYVRPPIDLLDDYPENNNVNTAEIEDNKKAIVDTLVGFKIACEIQNVTIGPAITRYDVIIEDKLNIKRALGYKDAIALSLKKDNVTAYLNYAKGAMSIEVPNNRRAVVGLKSMLTSSAFINSKPNGLVFGLGKNVDGEVVCPDITKMPHLLVAGTTGSGKSICLSALLISLLYKYGPEDLRLILVDPKQVEFISYDRLPHLMINEILYDVDKAIKALNWAIKEMERRYSLFKEMTENGVATKNLDEYNSHLPEGEEKLPKVVIILDEFGDLMLQAKKDIESRIIKLVQKARACGIHLVLATQRPSVDCITGLIKSNLPTRIGFKVNSFADSSTIFDIGGAEKLLGKGDMYFRSADKPELSRIQGCFVDTHEVQKVTDFVKANNESYFDQDVSDFINKVEEPETAQSMSDSTDENGDSKVDDIFIEALKYCIIYNQASVSMIQRRFPVGYIKACKIIDWMANMNYITPPEGAKPRKVLMTRDEFKNTYGDIDE